MERRGKMMKGKVFSLVIMVVFLLASMALIDVGTAQYTPGAGAKFRIKLPNGLQNMTVELGGKPGPGDQFNVSVEIQDVEGMTAFGLTLLWNSVYVTAKGCTVEPPGARYWLGPEIKAAIGAGNWSGPYIEYCTNNVTKDLGLPVPPNVGAFVGLAATAKGSEYALTGTFVLLILEFHVETYGPGWFYIWKDGGCGCGMPEDLWWPGAPSMLFTTSGWMSEAGPQPYDVVWAPGFGPPCAANTPPVCANAILMVKSPLPYPPEAEKTVEPDPPIVNETVTVTVTQTKPGFSGTADCPITNVTIDWGDTSPTEWMAPVAGVATFTHDYTAVGPYNITVYCYAEGMPPDLAWCNLTNPIEVIERAPSYTLTIYSKPFGVTFTVDGVSRRAPWSGAINTGASVSLIMPEIHTSFDGAIYCWNHWSDGNTSRSRTVTMNTNITLIANYTGPYQYQLTVTSSPIAGISFTINGGPQTTPSSVWLPECSCTLEMPETHNGYVWSHWLEDGDLNRIKTVTMDANITLTAVFIPDTTPPTISIVSPENKTYPVKDVPLTFTVSELTSWIGYSLDGQMNVTISGNTTIVGLFDGTHTITVYASDTAGNMGYSNTVYFTIDTVSPIIEILSPEEKAYATSSVSLSFTVDEATSWIGYSLDGQANITIAGNTTLTRLPDGMHSLVVYAKDIAGNIGSSNIVYFTIDTVPPRISIVSPENKTYDTTDISLTFIVDESVSWIGYSLDSQANITIAGNTVLTGLHDGIHSLIVYANDTAGNIGSSDIVYFTIETQKADTVSPIIEILSPEEKAYATSSVSLSFTVDEATSWIGYSLDGQANITIAGNTSLTRLPDGMHSLIVYASDMAGNIGSSNIVYFTIDTTPPRISIVSPENKTYDISDISLTFIVDEATSWIGYSLDGQANVTIAGKPTLSGLSDGSHSLTIYAKDMAGNIGSPDIVYFTIKTQKAEALQLWIVAAIVIIAVVGAALLVYFTKVKKKT